LSNHQLNILEIRQLTFDNKSLPYMRRISLSSLQQKIEEINEYENMVRRLENNFNILRNRINIVDGEELNLFWYSHSEYYYQKSLFYPRVFIVYTKPYPKYKKKDLEVQK